MASFAREEITIRAVTPTERFSIRAKEPPREKDRSEGEKGASTWLSVPLLLVITYEGIPRRPKLAPTPILPECHQPPAAMIFSFAAEGCQRL